MPQLKSGEKKQGIDSPFYICSIYALITVALNSDWNSSGLVWWGVVGLFIATSLCVQLTRHHDIYLNKNYALWLLGFLGICYLSIIWAKSSDIAITAMKTLVVQSIILLLLMSSIKTRKDIETLMKIISFASVTNAVYLLIFNISILTSATEEIGNRLGTEGTWNANAIGMMVSMSALLFLYFCIKTKNVKSRILYIVLMTFMVFIAFLTGSRKAFIMVLMAITIYIPFQAKGKRVRTLCATLALAVFIYYLIMSVPFLYNIIGWRMEAFLSLFGGQAEVDNSTKMRQTLITIGIDVWQDNFLLGCGIDCFRVYGLMNTGHNYYAHNNFIELLADVGLVGFSWYYYAYIYSAVNLWRRRKNKDIIKVVLVILFINLIIGYACVQYSDFLFQLFVLLMFACVAVTGDSQEV